MLPSNIFTPVEEEALTNVIIKSLGLFTIKKLIHIYLQLHIINIQSTVQNLEV